VADLDGEPALALLLRRLCHARSLGRTVVATSTEPADDGIEAVARSAGVGIYRGAYDDVLTRFREAASGHPGPLVRITADCPLIDPGIVDAAIRLFERTPGCDYASNVEPRSYPVGLDVEVMSRGALEWAAGIAHERPDREHVTAVIRRNLSRLSSATLVCEQQLGCLRWTLDTPEDLAFLRAVVSRLGARRDTARLDEILATVRREPSLADFHGRRG
jgi:spore coat polysaccharide biosynthesis protein SpsF (cytidylyltransferase family)